MGVLGVVMLFCSCQALMKKKVRVLSFSQWAVGQAIAHQYCELALFNDSNNMSSFSGWMDEFRCHALGSSQPTIESIAVD